MIGALAAGGAMVVVAVFSGAADEMVSGFSISLTAAFCGSFDVTAAVDSAWPTP